MKVTLYLDENEGNVLEVKDKILSVLHPNHIIFDNWGGDGPETFYIITSLDGCHYFTKSRSKESAIVSYVGHCNGMEDGKIFQNYAMVLSWEQLLATFNNKYATHKGDKIIKISS